MKRLVLLAFDGLDWTLLQALVDAGRMPCVTQLLTAGASGRLASTPPTAAAAVWASVATGVMADRHGLCHGLVARADGLTLAAAGRAALQARPLWDHAARAGWVTRVAGWPALLPVAADISANTDNRMVAAGFDDGSAALVDCWPLAPDVAWPASARTDVQAAQVHPDEVPDDAVQSLLGGVPEHLRAQAVNGARRLFARWATVQALGTGWLDAPGDVLLALRFDGLPGWMAELQGLVGANLPDALAPWYGWADLIVGRYMHLLGRSGHLVLVTDRGLPAGGYRGTRGLFDGGAMGGVLLSGPGVPPDSLLNHARSVDVCPTVLALLGLGIADATDLDGHDLLGAPTGGRAELATAAASRGSHQPLRDPPRDDAAVAWLREQGVAPVDTSAMRASVAAVGVDARLGWAAARTARGANDEAIDELTALLQSSPDHLGVRLALGQNLIAVGRASECVALLADAPAVAREGVWLDTFTALVAHAAGDWETAERHLLRLCDEGRAPFNAPAWLGWARLAQGDAAGARSWLERGRAWPGEAVRVFEGLGIACVQLGEPDAAITAFTRAIAEQPAVGRLHALRAAALEAAGDMGGAQAARWRALELDPRLPGTLEALTRAALGGVERRASIDGSRRPG